MEQQKTNKIVLDIELFSSKNSKRIVHNQKTGKTFLIPSLVAKEQEEVICAELTYKEGEWLKLIKNKKPPYKLHIFICRRTKHRFDYINIVQSLFDMMTKCEWWKDDNMNYVAPCFDGWGVDKKKPRIEMWIE